MPSSDPAAKRAVIEYLGKCGLPKSVFDIGMGAGEYGALFKSIAPSIFMIGLEIFPGYIRNDWGHSKVYDKIYIGDMRTFNYSKVNAELAIAGDVIEHVVKPEGIGVVEKLKERFDWVLVVLPIVEFIQGPDNEFNNPYEEHKYQWKREEAEKDLNMKLICEAGVCGVFEWKRTT